MLAALLTRGHQFMNGLGLTLFTLGLSTAALRLGQHFSSALPPTRQSKPRTPSSPHPQYYYMISLALGPLFWLGAIFLCAFGPASWRSRATFAIAFAPPGTLLRYFLSRKLNGLRAYLPLGTLAANLFAVLILAITVILQRNDLSRSSIGCSALQGIQDGFCGSLSTVSTFVVELRGLGKKDAYRYFGASWLAAMVIYSLVLGSFIWSQGEGTMCSFV